ncbi:MAG: hypothetical protein N4A49_08220 [Marinifilaceae bacterium]|jgi:hypothetical protein|nr:hypothetical protein [Marinifilaceae bacterium]
MQQQQEEIVNRHLNDNNNQAEQQTEKERFENSELRKALFDLGEKIYNLNNLNNHNMVNEIRNDLDETEAKNNFLRDSENKEDKLISQIIVNYRSFLDFPSLGNMLCKKLGENQDVRNSNQISMLDGDIGSLDDLKNHEEYIREQKNRYSQAFLSQVDLDKETSCSQVFKFGSVMLDQEEEQEIRGQLFENMLHSTLRLALLLPKLSFELKRGKGSNNNSQNIDDLKLEIENLIILTSEKSKLYERQKQIIIESNSVLCELCIDFFKYVNRYNRLMG